ncbi:hypothetical protein [Tychonema sp. LEGE 07203]|uniref:hypothetical protein n=1 Tax=Tychonema sp. LEGE 07203 TaxID=1828671 RepID=UPI001881B37E|nr:hypothetical protein [Tychonema sp. LEGE 07203]MBE9097089.1 hypothetical protein [Tychonema sp. LEGE 07203]
MRLSKGRIGYLTKVAVELNCWWLTAVGNAIFVGVANLFRPGLRIVLIEKCDFIPVIKNNARQEILLFLLCFLGADLVENSIDCGDLLRYQQPGNSLVGILKIGIVWSGCFEVRSLVRFSIVSNDDTLVNPT